MKSFFRIALALLFGAAVAGSCNTRQDEPACTITADRTAISDVAANAPGAEVVVVTTDAPYWIVITPDWIKADPTTGVGGGKSSIVTLTVASNYKNETTDTNPRSGNVVFSGGMTSLSIPVSQLGYTAYIDPSLGIGGIPDMNEFRDFIDAVNEGNSVSRWMNPVGEVELLTDLDLAEFGPDWVPIGAVEQTGNGNNACKPVGNAFSGIFNGGGHTIRNFNVSKNLEDVASGATFGLFGVLDNAVVKNLRVETDFTVSANGTADVGVVAGTVLSSTIENVTVTGKITSAGTTSTKRFALGGIAGFVYSVFDAESGNAYDSFIKDCKVDAEVRVDCGANTANGATCVMYGGIAAFATNIKDESRIHIEDCENSGSMTVNTGRCSGILPTANYGAIVKGCTNKASQLNTIENGRIGQIVCNLSTYSAVIDCVNEGDLTTTESKTTAAALVALAGDDTAYIEGGERICNTGTILAAFDPSTDSSNRNFSGLLCANMNKFDHISNIILSGRYGVYKADGNHEMYPVNSANIMEYIGWLNDAYKEKATNITYTSSGPEPETPETGGSITPLDPVDDTWD
ncbi:MAG: hypothetical protein IJ156_08825 [Bacteroidales bacterium]|nr:hypothetical protein [Bacteroidales bacterium]